MGGKYVTVAFAHQCRYSSIHHGGALGNPSKQYVSCDAYRIDQKYHELEILARYVARSAL